MDFDINQYLKELLRDAESSLPKEKVEVLREVLAHEKVAPRVKETVLMRSDYSRNMDKVREEEQTLNQKLRETEQFYQAQILADHNNAEAFQKLQQENQRLKTAVGSSDWGQPPEPQAQNANYLTKDEWQKRESELQSNALKLMGKTNYLSMKHYKEFNEVLDVDAWYKHAMDKGLPLEVAYDSYTAGLRQKRDEDRHKSELEKAREEGRMEAMSKAGMPLVDSHPHGLHALKTGSDIPRTSGDRIRAATEAYLRREGQ